MGKRKLPYLNPSRARKRSKKSIAVREVRRKHQEALLLQKQNEHNYSDASLLELSNAQHVDANEIILRLNKSLPDTEDMNKITKESESLVDLDIARSTTPSHELDKIPLEQQNEVHTPTTLGQFSFLSEKEYNHVMQHKVYYEPIEEPDVAPNISGHRFVDLDIAKSTTPRQKQNEHNYSDVSTASLLELSNAQHVDANEIILRLNKSLPDTEDMNKITKESESLVDLDIARSTTPSHELDKIPLEQQNEVHTPTTLGQFSFLSEKEYNHVMQHKVYYEPIEEPDVAPNISGHRIVDLSYLLNWAVNLQYKHAKICTSGRLLVKEEVRWGTGLVSKITFNCTMCPKKYTHFTEDPESKPSKINDSAVWGTLSTGSTFGHLEEFLSVMDIPPMSLYTFKQIETDLGGKWQDCLSKDMEEAGSLEREHALQEGNVDTDGIPFITVYLDGGWSKRSYGHSYNALSGLAVIIGKFTGKVLFLGVRNKYCSICSRAVNKQIPPGDHICYKNWSGSSAAMEADIVVEGFCKSEEMHGLRYKIFIADGDSSVYAKIRQKVTYGQEVIKKECTNHVVKNYGKAIRNMKNDKGIDPEARKFLTIKVIHDLEKRVHEAIYDNVGGDVEQLKKDVMNSPLHVFGEHKDCREIYCSNIGSTTDAKAVITKRTGLLLHINGALDNILKKCHKLIDNETNNRAKLFMAINARFNCGKRLNLVQRGSYQMRSHLTGLRYNNGVNWHYKSWKSIMEKSPGQHFKKYIQSQVRSNERKAVCRILKPLNTQIKRRLEVSQNVDYGPKAEEAALTEEEYNSEFNRRLQEMQISGVEEQKQIAEEMVGQFESCSYLARRKNRLTASFFGQVAKRREGTSCHSLVTSIVSNQIDIKSPALQYGKNKEPMVRKRYENENNITIHESGLYIDVNRGYLAASPDGLLGSEGLIEIKCLYSVQKQSLRLRDAVEDKKVSCLHIDSRGNIKLNRNHNYYYQIQGQLNITNRSFCQFIVYSGDNNPLWKELKKTLTFG